MCQSYVSLIPSLYPSPAFGQICILSSLSILDSYSFSLFSRGRFLLPFFLPFAYFGNFVTCFPSLRFAFEGFRALFNPQPLLPLHPSTFSPSLLGSGLDPDHSTLSRALLPSGRTRPHSVWQFGFVRLELASFTWLLAAPFFLYIASPIFALSSLASAFEVDHRSPVSQLRRGDPLIWKSCRVDVVVVVQTACGFFWFLLQNIMRVGVVTSTLPSESRT
ncbi:hypothetical protein SISSUDRAFT_709942 [Sistotremastrum suecicum HHB10207 ss-3]|uniref:Uncharacterized protein n=1 Tax=Sistotremastrum suecicum HHB10207 ss-3 TaxID=1314776 RepID=A0A166DR40_9AGAM|nr:hypothetical protein SISSUDRAFT_709942 [Sistotremastrum suecicum HHB10207 ss-3]